MRRGGRGSKGSGGLPKRPGGFAAQGCDKQPRARVRERCVHHLERAQRLQRPQRAREHLRPRVAEEVVIEVEVTQARAAAQARGEVPQRVARQLAAPERERRQPQHARQPLRQMLAAHDRVTALGVELRAAQVECPHLKHHKAVRSITSIRMRGLRSASSCVPPRSSARTYMPCMNVNIRQEHVHGYTHLARSASSCVPPRTSARVYIYIYIYIYIQHLCVPNTHAAEEGEQAHLVVRQEPGVPIA